MPRVPVEDYLIKDQPKPSWLVEGVLPRNSMIILAGDPGVGKSVLCYALSLALAVGGNFLSRPVEKGKVLYFDEENSAPDLHAYLHNLWRGLGRPDPELVAENLRIEHFSLAPVPAAPYDVMRRTVEEQQPQLVVLDTATPICRIEDENSNAEASRAIRQLRLVKARAPKGCTFLILKHARVDGVTGKRDIRGAKAWKGELDSVLFHIVAPGRPPKGQKWRRTQLEPSKVRAYGLREPLLIEPEVRDDGMILTARPVAEVEEEEDE